MAPARWALTLIVLLVALPARAVGRAQAVGVNSLSLNSSVSRSAGAGSILSTAGNEAGPNTAEGKADTNPVDANSFQKYCIEGIVAVLGSMLLGMVLCCVLHVWRKRRMKK